MFYDIISFQAMRNLPNVRKVCIVSHAFSSCGLIIERKIKNKLKDYRNKENMLRLQTKYCRV